MHLFELRNRIPEKLYDSLSFDYKELRPPQELAIKAGLLERQNIVVSSPTSSGKSLVAEIACIKNILEGRGKAVYVVPLKALANEKYNDFKKKYPFVKTALSIGDYDSSDPWLGNYDLIVVTSEKLDSLIRHSSPWLNRISTLVIDEVHLLDDPSRGPTLEILITRLKNMLKSCQIIALSATIKNAKEIADWLSAILVKSDYRPVELKEGVYYDKIIYFDNDKEEVLGSLEVPELRIVEDTLIRKKSVLVFLSSRKNAEAVAKKCAKIVQKYISKEEKKKLEKLSKEVLNVLETPTKQCKILSECIKSGAAFHHAGLLPKQRELIENAFRKRIIKVICCTPTLALGLNIPAFRVLVRDLKRYANGYSDFIPVLEYKQWVGRAGRPGLENFGEGITIAKTRDELKMIFEKYVHGEPEEIYSKLSAEPILRMHTLGLIASTEIITQKSLLEFFSKTFFAFQYKDLTKIEMKIDKIINELIDFEFIKKEKNYLMPTKLGKRVAELYIDPYSAYLILERLRKSTKKDIYYLHTICSCVEMFPLLSIKPREFTEIQKKFLKFEEFLPEIPNPYDYEYETFVKAFKTSLMFYDWINEMTEDKILERYNETPGIFRSRLAISDWLLYSMEELAKFVKKEEISEIKKLRKRMKYGVKEELLKFVSISGIGRVRARKLYNTGIKTISDLRKIPLQKLEKIIGKKTASKIKKQILS